MKRKLTARYGEKTFHRTTERDYTHVVIAVFHDGPSALRWTSKEDFGLQEIHRLKKITDSAVSKVNSPDFDVKLNGDWAKRWSTATYVLVPVEVEASK